MVSKEYTVLLRLCKIAGYNTPSWLPDNVEGFYAPSFVVKEGKESPYVMSPYTQFDNVYVGSEWLQNNLSDEEMAQWVALRLLGKLDKPTIGKDKFGNVANYGGEAAIPLSRDSDGKLGVYQNRGFLDKAIKGAVVNMAKIIAKNILVGKIDA